MSITAAELKLNLQKYLLIAETEDVFITENGRIIAKLTNPFQKRIDKVKALIGILPADITAEEAKRERLDRI